MSLFIASLNSGSNGNCYYVGNRTHAVLVDAGISCREIEKRMNRCGLPMERVKAIFISHEHSDHIRGLEVLSKKFQLPVYITQPAFQNTSLKIDQQLLRYFSNNDSFYFGELKVKAFPKWHDAADPCSFIVEYKEIKAGVLTDIGSVCEHVIRNFSECHAAFLEANYDEEMLSRSGYPIYLQNRIRGDKGHLSNDQSLKLFLDHRNEKLSHLVLSHLSKNNNSPKLVEELFSPVAGNTLITVASRYKESEVYHITGDQTPVKTTAPVQMTLF
jgi:phosphoribosyl 1,2-cyclic phosphodiesterase